VLAKIEDLVLRIGKRQLRHERIIVSLMDLIQEHVQHGTEKFEDPVIANAARRRAVEKTKQRLAKIGMALDEERKADPMAEVADRLGRIEAALAERTLPAQQKRSLVRRITKANRR
jgi:hypothetical protein